MSDELIPSNNESVEELLEYGASHDIGPAIETLFAVIRQRGRDLPESSYTAKMLTCPEDKLLKKIGEEAVEVVMAAKDSDVDQLRYETADLVYHLLLVMHRWGLSPTDLAQELESRFK